MEKGIIAILIGTVLAVFGAGAASAEPGNREQAYQECRSRQADFSAAKEILDNREFGENPDDYNISKNEDVQRLKDRHPERFEEIRRHYEDNQSLTSRIGRTADGFTCTALSPTDAGVAEVKDKASKFWDDPLGKFVQALIEGNTQALSTAMTLWTKFEINPEKTTEQARGVQNIVWGLAGVAFVLSLIVTGARIAATRRQGVADGMEDFGKFYGTYLVVGVMVPMIIPLALAGTDWLTRQILTGLPGDKDFGEVMGLSSLDESVAGPALLLILVLFALLGSLAQMVALAARVLILPIIVGFLPVGAAAAVGNGGRASMNSMLSWVFAAIAFKPVAALVYVVAFWVVSTDTIKSNSDDATLAIFKVLILGIAGFSPLIVVKIISPLLASAGGQNTGAVAGALGGAAAMGGAVLGGVAMAAGGGARALGAGGRAGAVAGGGKGAGGGGGGRVLGGSPSGPSGGGSGGPGGSPSSPGGGPSGGGPSGGGAGGPATGALGGAPAAASGGSTGGSVSAAADQAGGDRGGVSTSTPSGRGGRLGGIGRTGGAVARGVGSGAARGAATGLGAVAGGAKIASRVASRGGAALSRTSNLSGVFEDAGGTIRK